MDYNYLTNRNQHAVNGSVSESTTVISGVPQGSVLVCFDIHVH